MLDTVLRHIDESAAQLIAWQRQLVAIPALGPDNGGSGEAAKVEALESIFSGLGFSLQRIDAPDSRVPCGVRPNLVARMPGKTAQTLWILAHTDVVPPGDLALWTGDPWTLRVHGDTMLGRGVEDNHQGILSALAATSALVRAGVPPRCSVGVLLVADEETGNRYGIDYLLAHHQDLFAPDDMFVVPDAGEPDGLAIEIAEKSMLWAQITVTGKQCHASRPQLGANTLVASAHLIVALAEELPKRFPQEDTLFSPSVSTFTPTKKDANVPNINTVPGQDVFYVDCRILPSIAVEEVEAAMSQLAAATAAQYGVQIAISPVLRQEAAPPTPADSMVVRLLTEAIQADRGKTPRCVGIGGGTVAAELRRHGFSAAVWSTLLGTAHQPDEKASIANTLADARVLARMLLSA
ncbi:MAG: acetylornithine deacetylase or succinyl-diaminopimelate desuccinylase [Desulfomicrobiaceae bacterium]|jgi:succinyl-diaminopimelate desuccinylase|nr:M20 family metallo-hydrolase [Desulfomicrobiaceae bacterium]MBZ4647771.1 acetylornithine deacetylase or succinyl-diaminopimelate desuccinylase [Desulfomicrobiaceae bacterium]MBZ4685437.1 acetylornithine deacetylase or succinyl-diaminopimelate desuccinylase [Desulfomicrobiaceae bacterium]MDI3492521.1 succinyl-diaminopimelate desuccinylase [Desulfomicrobiaceae bacterium]MDK2872564.1 succinyl-diaminopimelate desuccinylase [Desulfomicrobiaceae bacterium]